MNLLWRSPEIWFAAEKNIAEHSCPDFAFVDKTDELLHNSSSPKI